MHTPLLPTPLCCPLSLLSGASSCPSTLLQLFSGDRVVVVVVIVVVVVVVVGFYGQIFSHVLHIDMLPLWSWDMFGLHAGMWIYDMWICWLVYRYKTCSVDQPIDDIYIALFDDSIHFMTWLWTPKYQGLKRPQLGLARWPSLYSGHCARRFVWKTCMSVSILSHFYVCSFHYILINIPNNHKPSCVWYTFFPCKHVSWSFSQTCAAMHVSCNALPTHM